MGAPNCNFDYLYPGGVDCSGFGTCRFNNVTGKSFCVCQPGRRAISDMAFDPIDCDQSELAYMICWGMFAICTGGCAIYGTYELIEQGLMPNTNRGLYINIAVATISAVLASTVGILKIVDEKDRYMGQDIAVSTLLSIAATLWWISVILFVDRLFVALVGKNNGTIIDVAVSSSPRYTMLILVVVVYPLPPLLCNIDPDNCNEYARLFFLGKFVLVLIGASYVLYSARKLIRALEMAFESQDLAKPIQQPRTDSVFLLKSRLKTVVFVTTIGFSLTFSFIVMGFWPYMLRKYGYAYALICSVGYVVCGSFIAVLSSSSYHSRALPTLVSSMGRKFGTKDSRPSKTNVKFDESISEISGVEL